MSIEPKLLTAEEMKQALWVVSSGLPLDRMAAHLLLTGHIAAQAARIAELETQLAYANDAAAKGDNARHLANGLQEELAAAQERLREAYFYLLPQLHSGPECECEYGHTCGWPKFKEMMERIAAALSGAMKPAPVAQPEFHECPACKYRITDTQFINALDVSCPRCQQKRVSQFRPVAQAAAKTCTWDFERTMTTACRKLRLYKDGATTPSICPGCSRRVVVKEEGK